MQPSLDTLAGNTNLPLNDRVGDNNEVPGLLIGS